MLVMAGPRRRAVFLVLAAATADKCLSISPCEAFVRPSLCKATRCPGLATARFGMTRPNEDGDDAQNNDRDAVEAERKRLEALAGDGGGNIADKAQDGTWDEQLAAGPPPLTAIGRERLETEVALLESLEDGNGAVDRLWELWYHERGPGPAAELAATDMLVARGPGSFDVAEDMLRKLIRREGIYWTEAVNRLATLLFLQRKFQESKEACEAVLRVKPWHFGALSGIVMVCQGINDMEGVVGWAGQRMPPLQAELSPVMGDGVVRETRSEWVERMVEEARKRLRIAERDVQESFLGLETGDSNEGAILGDNDDGAWE